MTETTLNPALPAVDLTVGELAALAKGRADGDAAFKVAGANGLSEAGPSDVSFLGNPKYAADAAATKAGCVFLPVMGGEKIATPTKNRIYVEDPQYAFSLVLQHIEAKRPKVPVALSPKAEIHYQAKMGPNVTVGAFTVIERGAAVAEGTTVGPQCYIGENVKIGRGCKIYPQVVIRENCVIGDRVIIHSGTVIGSDGYGFSTDRKTGKHRKIPQLGNVVVGDDVEIQAGVTIDRATIGSTVIGAGTKIDNQVQIGHNVQVGKDCLFVSQVGIAGSCTIGDGVILAGQAGIAGHLKIGDRAIVMAKTGIMGDIEPGKMYFGVPGRPHRETLKLQAYFGRLPELFDALKEVKAKLGMDQKSRSEA